MKNYEYIIASLPVLRQDAAPDADALLEDIRSQLDGRDRDALDFLLRGFDPDALDREFYLEAAEHRNAFIRGYFAYDLQVRNAKVRWLNSRLGRSAEQDTVSLVEDEAAPDCPEAYAALGADDVLERERRLDDLMWAKVEEMTLMHVFDLDLILGFAARLQTVSRWSRLDPETGREMFHRLVAEIRSTYDNKKNDKI